MLLPTLAGQQGRQQQQQRPQARPQARPLTAAEAEAGAEESGTLMYEVVLPLPGPGVILPANAIGEVRLLILTGLCGPIQMMMWIDTSHVMLQFYRGMLEADGLWQLLGPQPAAQEGAKAGSGSGSDAVVSVRGAYRPLLVRAC